MIIIGGATASGKSSIALALAKRLGGELVSCDSMQIYRGMDVGTAKDVGEIGVPLHLTDVVDPCEPFTVFDYRALAVDAIRSVSAKDKPAIVVGGTGLYVNSLLYNMEYGGSREEDTALKAELEAQLEANGAEYMHGILAELDAVTAQKVHYNNTKRVLRAIYVAKTSGKPLSAQHAELAPVEPFKLFVVKRERAELQARINARVDEMFANGLEAEVKSLLDRGCGFDLQSMQAIGYKEWRAYFEGTASLAETAELIKKNTRAYAKRQETWFNNQYKEFAVSLDGAAPITQTLDEICSQM